MTDCLLVYITASGKDEAEILGRTLVEERLAACVNILDTVSSLYWWQGAMERAGETLCLFKTTVERFPDFSRRAKELHSYETPCIVALPLACGDADYLDWIRAETRSGHP